MMSRIPEIKNRMRVNLAGLGSVASTVVVQWRLTSGGTIDPGTQSLVGATETYLSGALRAFGYEVPARGSVVKFAEIQVGDLILDLAGEPEVAVYDGQIFMSGTKPLDDLADLGLRFQWNGCWYSSKEVGADLQAAWDAFVADQRLHRTLLLKRLA